MNSLPAALAGAALYVIFAPFIGGLVAGIDRKITAKMQGRVGPPILQPFYDVLKLFEKEKVVVSRSQNFYVLAYIVFIVFSGALFFSGGDLLLVIFALTLAHVFLVLGAYSAFSPYSQIGAERELIQVMTYEPMIILYAVGMYMATGSFYVSEIATSGRMLIAYLPGIFLGFIYILTMKLRKSPFDLSTSHHAHQELVKGVTTEFSGSTLARVDISHWYENVLLLGFIYLFFAFNPALAVVAIFATYLLEIFIDNTYARFKWPLAMKSSWLVAALLGVVNIAALYYVGGLM
ncbi:MAG: NADH-quinone oxidoreductase subunit H [Candidatus Altiarchaeota archaeon]|nr:NADH-quinone oxidoreductase subunit H [Candidatus Altiarchaeota archaeon]